MDIQALSQLNATRTRYKILAVTRDPSADKPKALASLPGVDLVKFLPDQTEDLFAKERIYGVFLVQNPAAPEVKLDALKNPFVAPHS